MSPRLQIFVIVASVLVFLLILELIRRGRLREEYSLIWLGSAIVVLILAFFRGSTDAIARIFQIEYSPSLLFMFGIGLVVVIQLIQTIALSKLTSLNRELAQRQAMLELRLQYHLSQVAPQLITTVSRLSLEHFNQMRQEVDEHLPIPIFLKRTLMLAIESLSADSGSIIVLNHDGNLIEAALSRGGKELNYDIRGLDETIKKGLAGWVLENRQPALVINTYDDPRWLSRPWDQKLGKPRSAISVPLISEERVIGVLTLVQPSARQFTENDLALLMSIAAVVSISGKRIFQGPINLPEMEASIAGT